MLLFPQGLITLVISLIWVEATCIDESYTSKDLHQAHVDLLSCASTSRLRPILGSLAKLDSEDLDKIMAMDGVPQKFDLFLKQGDSVRSTVLMTWLRTTRCIPVLVPTIMAVVEQESVERRLIGQQILDCWVPGLLERKPDVAATWRN